MPEVALETVQFRELSAVGPRPEPDPQTRAVAAVAVLMVAAAS